MPILLLSSTIHCTLSGSACEVYTSLILSRAYFWGQQASSTTLLPLLRSAHPCFWLYSAPVIRVPTTFWMLLLRSTRQLVPTFCFWRLENSSSLLDPASEIYNPPKVCKLLILSCACFWGLQTPFWRSASSSSLLDPASEVYKTPSPAWILPLRSTRVWCPDVPVPEV